MESTQLNNHPLPDDDTAVPRPSVVLYRFEPHGHAPGHDTSTKTAVARKLAEVLGYDFAGEFDPVQRPHGRRLYFVPTDTLYSVDDARRLGIHGEQDLFGGVVPHPFVGTKTITHPLVSRDARAPTGWSPEHAACVREVVLPGYSAYAVDDARRAGLRLLEGGAVRVKDAGGVGGGGQEVVSNPQQLEAHLQALDTEVLSRQGIVLERNLHKVKTHSVGQVSVAGLTVSYFGTQRLVKNPQGHDVYGGSRLYVTRGGLEELLELDLAGEVRTAVEQALAYHRAALLFFPDMFASRCNYDVAQGFDDGGQWRSGVLEQSWRIGGASGAEVGALQALLAEPSLPMVRASTNEVYGEEDAAPPGAWIHYDGPDKHGGRLVKYVQVEPYGGPGVGPLPGQPESPDGIG